LTQDEVTTLSCAFGVTGTKVFYYGCNFKQDTTVPLTEAVIIDKRTSVGDSFLLKTQVLSEGKPVYLRLEYRYHIVDKTDITEYFPDVRT